MTVSNLNIDIMARPLKEINWEAVERMIEVGNSAREIYGHFRVQDNTFYRKFKEEFGCSFQDYRGDVSLAGPGNIKYIQYLKAIGGNIEMLKWCGKEMCGQGREPQARDAPNEAVLSDQMENMRLKHQLALQAEEIERLKNGNKC